MSSKTEARRDAVRAIHQWAQHYVLPTLQESSDWRPEQADELISRIRALHGMSRSGRWNDAVERYAILVEEERDSGGHVNWAYVQGAVWFGYATEGLI